MSVLGGAIGAGAVLALIGHEMSLAREAEKLEEERIRGEILAQEHERLARVDRLENMRGATEARMQNRMMRAGIVPTMRGRSARAAYLSETALRSSPGRIMGDY
jgi:hypothetical protein